MKLRKYGREKTTKEFENLREKLRKKQRQNLKKLKSTLVPQLTKYPKQHMAVAAADVYNTNFDGATSSAFCPSHSPAFFTGTCKHWKTHIFSCSMADFWKMYLNTSPNKRHYYEIIRAGFPCRLYFDCEFYKDFNPQLDVQEDGRRLVNDLVRLTACSLQMLFGIMVTREAFLILESSTDKKCSYHIIVHLPRNQLFETNIQVGIFVRWLGESCRPQTSSESVPTNSRFSNLWVKGRKSDQREFFADQAVYTKNRAFRLLYSSKFGKVQPLLPSSSLNKFNYDNFFEPGEYQLFQDSLICASCLENDTSDSGSDQLPAYHLRPHNEQTEHFTSSQTQCIYKGRNCY